MSTSGPADVFSGRTAWARNLAAPLRTYLSTQTGGAAVMLGALIAALVWANLDYGSYQSVWTTKLSFTLGSGHLSLDLRQWVDEGLMTFFFLVVGLEAKRELDLGELRDRRRVAIPVLAAFGGVTVPILIYVAFNAGGPGAHGWGAAMSTDTAFALGLLALLVPRTATRLRVFLLTLAVVDDLIALLVIATVYTSHVNVTPLVIALALFAVIVTLRFVPLRWRRPIVIALGFALWVAMFKSGVDPLVSGLAVGLVISAYPPERSDLERVTELARSFREQPTPELARSTQRSLVSAISANERLQYTLHPWTSYVIVPLFALANAGIHDQRHVLSSAVALADHAGDLLRLRGRQADRDLARVVARDPAVAGWRAARDQPAGDAHRRRRGRRRFHGFDFDRHAGLPRPAARRRKARGRSRRRSGRGAPAGSRSE